MTDPPLIERPGSRTWEGKMVRAVHDRNFPLLLQRVGVWQERDRMGSTAGATYWMRYVVPHLLDVLQETCWSEQRLRLDNEAMRAELEELRALRDAVAVAVP